MKNEKKGPRLDGVFDFVDDSSSSNASTQPLHLNPMLTTTILHTPEDDLLPQTHVTVAAAGPILPDHMVLYKGKGVTELSNMTASGQPMPFITHDGKINMISIRSYPGGDFNMNEDAWYWTPEEATAEQYRAWAARRNGFSETWIIRIQVPNAFFTPLNKTSLWFSGDWKEYVWYCKKGGAGPIPAKLDKYWRGRDIIRGHIAAKHPARYERTDSANVQTGFSEDDVLKNGIEKATQWVVMNRATADLMAVAIQGKIHIDVRLPAAIAAL